MRSWRALRSLRSCVAAIAARSGRPLGADNEGAIRDVARVVALATADDAKEVGAGIEPGR